MNEKWKDYYTDDSLRRLQSIELELLREFIRVCDKLELEYVVYGGTLLGVEKYGGFIPWDDDIDVALPRDSYTRLVEQGPQIISDGFFLQSPYNCPKSPFPYSKLRKRGTKYIDYANRNVDIESGIYIDIYPIDRIPDNEKLRRKQFKSIRRWILIYVARQTPLYDKEVKGLPENVKKICKWIFCHLAKIFSQRFCIARIDRCMTMYNGEETKRYAALNSPNYENIYESFYPLQQKKFEDMEVSVPKDYQAHLRKRYGDYTKLPDAEHRYGHIPYILDLGDNK